MKHYKISRVEEDRVYLSYVSKDEEVLELSIADLENFTKANKVYGYNPIAKTVKTTTSEEAQKQYIAKYKLAGVEKKDELSATYEIGKYSEDTNTLNVTMTFRTDEEYECIFNSVFLKSNNTLNSLAHDIYDLYGDKAQGMTINLDVLYDIGEFTIVDRDTKENTLQAFRGVPFTPQFNLNSIDFTDRVKFNNTKVLGNIFPYIDSITDPIIDELRYRDVFKLDLSGFTLEKIECLHKTFESLGELPHTYPKVQLDDPNKVVDLDSLYVYTSFKEEDFYRFLEFIFKVRPHRTALDSMGFLNNIEELHLSKLVEIFKDFKENSNITAHLRNRLNEYEDLIGINEYNVSHRVSVHKLIVDCKVDGRLFGELNNLGLEINNFEFTKDFSMPVYNRNKQECNDLLKKFAKIKKDKTYGEYISFKNDWLYIFDEEVREEMDSDRQEPPEFLEDSIKSFVYGVSGFNHREINNMTIRVKGAEADEPLVFDLTTYKDPQVSREEIRLFLLCLFSKAEIGLEDEELEDFVTSVYIKDKKQEG